jgi:hypothetical protein
VLSKTIPSASNLFSNEFLLEWQPWSPQPVLPNYRNSKPFATIPEQDESHLHQGVKVKCQNEFLVDKYEYRQTLYQQ